MSTIRCDIVSAEQEIFRGEATLVVATGELGELGIAPRHAPLITRLKPGYVRVTTENGEQQEFYVSGGILEVQPQVVTVLADTEIRAEDIYEAAVRSNSVVLDQPVLADGRRELMPYLLEQAVSVTMHRFGIIRNVGNLRDE